MTSLPLHQMADPKLVERLGAAGDPLDERAQHRGADVHHIGEHHERRVHVVGHRGRAAIELTRDEYWRVRVGLDELGGFEDAVRMRQVERLGRGVRT